MSVRKEQLAENVTVWCGDCRDVLPTLPKFDAVCTDPPYGIGIDGQKGSLRKNGTLLRKAHEHKGWDKAPPSSETFSLVQSAGVRLILWGGNYFVEHIDARKGWLVWDKEQTGLSMSDAELAYTNLDIPTRVKKLHRTHLWQENPEHPTQKPLKLMLWCLSLLPPDCRSVIDPFMGSGTTGVAAVSLGLEFVGIEADGSYFDIACRRIADELRRPRLFAEPVTKPVQEALFG